MSEPHTPEVLIVEDDAALRSGLAALLAREGFLPHQADSAEQGFAVLSERACHPDLVLLDLMLPGIDGEAFLKHVRKTHPELPVVVISAKGSVPDKVLLLEGGADDYLVKPFSGEELVARMRAVLKRYHKLEGEVRRCGPLEIDLAARTVLRDGVRVSLSSIQFKILEALVLKAGAVVTRDQIIDRVWGLDPPESPRSVDYHILQLRRKLEEDPEAPRWILTEPGHGYRFEL